MDKSHQTINAKELHCIIFSQRLFFSPKKNFFFCFNIMEDVVPRTIAIVASGAVHHVDHYGNMDAIAVQKEEDMNISTSSSVITQTFPGHILPDGIIYTV